MKTFDRTLFGAALPTLSLLIFTACVQPGAAAESPPFSEPTRGPKLPPLAPRPGYVIGRAVFEDGRPIPNFTVTATGFDGEAIVPAGAPSLGTVEGANGSYVLRTLDTVNHKTPVSATVTGVRALARIDYRGKPYVIEMHPLDGQVNGPGPGDFRGNSGKGVVRDFVLKMTGLRPGYEASEPTEGRTKASQYGGTINVDCSSSQGEYPANEDASSLTKAHSKSVVELTLTPSGALLDGSPGSPIIRTFHPGGDWRERCLLGIPYGAYSAAARISGGANLRLRMDQKSSGVWQAEVTVLWVPAGYDSSHQTINPIRLYPGQ